MSALSSQAEDDGVALMSTGSLSNVVLEGHVHTVPHPPLQACFGIFSPPAQLPFSAVLVFVLVY